MWMFFHFQILRQGKYERCVKDYIQTEFNKVQLFKKEQETKKQKTICLSFKNFLAKFSGKQSKSK